MRRFRFLRHRALRRKSLCVAVILAAAPVLHRSGTGGCTHRCSRRFQERAMSTVSAPNSNNLYIQLQAPWKRGQSQSSAAQGDAPSQSFAATGPQNANATSSTTAASCRASRRRLDLRRHISAVRTADPASTAGAQASIDRTLGARLSRGRAALPGLDDCGLGDQYRPGLVVRPPPAHTIDVTPQRRLSWRAPMSSCSAPASSAPRSRSISSSAACRSR